MIGQTLTHYQILEELGSGGMGVVYRGRDTKLHRDVAIKVLPEDVTTPERLARFEREAHLLAALNHANIATIHGLDESNGVHFLVLEVVEGETLAERIARRPLSVEDALSLFHKIAEGLEAAHEKGIVHRDLKPANIKITPDGHVKILDFGLGKVFDEPEAPGVDLSQSPTITREGTRTGVILGTASYMSPEQARGDHVDKRTDIWAFGCCLYEALTGKPTFWGATVTDIIASVVKTVPDWEALPADTPVAIQKLLRRCLKRDPKERLRDIGDARLELKEALSRDAEAGPMMAFEAAGSRRVPWAIAAASGVVAVVSVWSLSHAPDPTERSPVRLRVEVSPEEPLYVELGRSIALSPDGQLLTYVAGTRERRNLYLRHLAALRREPLPDTEGAENPFFSPDGKWIGFGVGRTLRKISVSGGEPVTLSESPFNEGTWGPDDTIVFTGFRQPILYRVPASGGQPEAIAKTPRRGEGIYYSHPHFLPGGEAVLFTVGSVNGDPDIEVLNLHTGESKLVHGGGNSPVYLSTGHLAFAREGTLYAAPFDLDRLELSGTPVPFVSGLGYSTSSRTVHYTVSDSGTLLYLPEGEGSRIRVRPSWVARDGTVRPLSIPAGDYWQPVLSPDGDRLALDHAGEVTRDIWLYELARGSRTRLTLYERFDWYPVWTPDGRRVTFGSSRSGTNQIHWKRSDGSSEAEQLTELTGIETLRASSWSPDGKTLAFYTLGMTGYDLWTLSLNEGGKANPPRELLKTPFNELDAVFSPDGRWLAYSSDESGRMEVYIRPYPDGEGRWQLSTDGGRHPRWASASGELFYREGEKIMIVPYSAEEHLFRAESPRELVRVPVVNDGVHSGYDVSPDGRRFVVFVPENGGGGPTHVIMIQNWFEELERLAPTEN